MRVSRCGGKLFAPQSRALPASPQALKGLTLLKICLRTLQKIMYVIVVYDVEVERVDKVRKFLRMYLHWRQNSVFEGEVSDAQLAKIRVGLEEIADEKADSVIIYKMKSKRYFETELIGIEKSPMGMIL